MEESVKKLLMDLKFVQQGDYFIHSKCDVEIKKDELYGLSDVETLKLIVEKSFESIGNLKDDAYHEQRNIAALYDD